jgi:hypothetical protein
MGSKEGEQTRVIEEVNMIKYIIWTYGKVTIKHFTVYSLIYTNKNVAILQGTNINLFKNKIDLYVLMWKIIQNILNQIIEKCTILQRKLMCVIGYF